MNTVMNILHNLEFENVVMVSVVNTRKLWSSVNSIFGKLSPRVLEICFERTYVFLISDC